MRITYTGVIIVSAFLIGCTGIQTNRPESTEEKGSEANGTTQIQQLSSNTTTVSDTSMMSGSMMSGSMMSGSMMSGSMMGDSMMSGSMMGDSMMGDSMMGDSMMGDSMMGDCSDTRLNARPIPSDSLAKSDSLLAQIDSASQVPADPADHAAHH